VRSLSLSPRTHAHAPIPAIVPVQEVHLEALFWNLPRTAYRVAMTLFTERFDEALYSAVITQPMLSTTPLPSQGVTNASDGRRINMTQFSDHIV
jgi:hypothetical protein